MSHAPSLPLVHCVSSKIKEQSKWMRSLLHHWWDMGGIQKNFIWQGGDKESQPDRSSVSEQTHFLFPHYLTNHKNGLWKTWLMWLLNLKPYHDLISCAMFLPISILIIYVKTIFLNQKKIIKLQQGGKKQICTRNHIFFVFGMSGPMIDLTTVAMETCVSGVDWQLTQFEGCLTSKIEVRLHV